MDTLTHIALGACIGEIVAGRQIGKKALVLGALAQNLPDIDFVASFWLPTAGDVMAHRGFTHSLLFAMLVTPLLAWYSTKIFRTGGMEFRRWVLFWGLQILVHIFIDAFNAYGTGWFEPFSHYRVSFNTLFVADPLFTLWPAIAAGLLFVSGLGNRKRIAWAKAGLGLSGLYLLCGVAFKLYIDNAVAGDLKEKGIAAGRYFTTPTPLNNMLWYVVAEGENGYYAGYKSVFDKKNAPFRYVYRNDSLLKNETGSAELKTLKRFSQGYYSAEMWHDTLVFNDMRFGEMLGWRGAETRFVFHYFLRRQQDNKLIVQRGRFAGWDKATFHAFLRRIKGI